MTLLIWLAPSKASPAKQCRTAACQAKKDTQILAFFAKRPRLARTPAGLRQVILAQQRQIARLHRSQARLSEQVRSLQSATSTPRGYARHLAAKRGWTGYQWDALDTIIGRESGWNPCASYPGRNDCSYSGSSACGVPQANPCPEGWRGRLGVTWREQVRWLLDYIVSHGYGSPAAALDYWERNRSY